MLSDEELQDLYKDRIGAEARALFFADQASRFHSLGRDLTFATIELSSGAAAGFLGKFNPLWASGFALLAAIVSAANFALQIQRRAVEASGLQAKWNQVALDLKALWYTWSTDEASARLAAIQAQEVDLSSKGATFSESPKAMIKWETMVHKEYGLPTV